MSPWEKQAKAYVAWAKFANAYANMSISAGEVILRRGQRMATGAMAPPEAVGMVLEKATAFAAAAERAAIAAARGGDVAKVATAALSPYGAKTASNVRKLRGKK